MMTSMIEFLKVTSPFDKSTLAVNIIGKSHVSTLKRMNPHLAGIHNWFIVANLTSYLALKECVET